jgi:YidC/Oxa1 family membrane protein insertase
MIAPMTTALVSILALLDQVLGGSLGGAILALSLGVRIALLPLTLRLVRRAQRNQAVLQELRPEIEALRRRFAKQPDRLYGETMKLYRRHKMSPFDGPALLGGFVQIPVFGLLYGAIKRSLSSSRAFLWIRNLSAPDILLTLTILALTAMTAFWMPSASEQARTTMIVIQVVITALIVWKLAAGLGLYWVSSSAVGLFQALWLRRHAARGVSPA